MNVRFVVVGLVGLAAFAAGCTRIRVTSVLVDPDAKGVRYSLPQPALRVVPKANGSLDVSVVYLPDPDAQYAIDAASYAARHQLTVLVEGGLLKKVAWQADDTTVAADLIKASGEIAKSVVDQEATKRFKQKDAIEDARVTLREKEANLKAEEAKLEVLTNASPADPAKIETQKLLVAEARARRDAASDAVDEARRDAPFSLDAPSVSFSGTSGTFTVKSPEDATATAAVLPIEISGGPYAHEVYGPAIFALEEVGTGDQARARLVPLKVGTFTVDGAGNVSGPSEETQPQFSTGPAGLETEEVRITPSGVQVAAKDAASGLKIAKYEASIDLGETEIREVVCRPLDKNGNPGAPLGMPPPVTHDGKKAFTVVVDDLDPGLYQLDFKYKFKPPWSGQKQSMTFQRTFKVPKSNP